LVFSFNDEISDVDMFRTTLLTATSHTVNRSCWKDRSGRL